LWKYLQKQEHQLLIEGGVKALPFLTGFTQPLTASAHVAPTHTVCSFCRHAPKALLTTVAILSNIASSLRISKGSSAATAVKALLL
jgi:hypothetical protein